MCSLQECIFPHAVGRAEFGWACSFLVLSAVPSDRPWTDFKCSVFYLLLKALIYLFPCINLC